MHAGRELRVSTTERKGYDQRKDYILFHFQGFELNDQIQMAHRKIGNLKFTTGRWEKITSNFTAGRNRNKKVNFKELHGFNQA